MCLHGFTCGRTAMTVNVRGRNEREQNSVCLHPYAYSRVCVCAWALREETRKMSRVSEFWGQWACARRDDAVDRCSASRGFCYHGDKTEVAGAERARKQFLLLLAKSKTDGSSTGWIEVPPSSLPSLLAVRATPFPFFSKSQWLQSRQSLSIRSMPERFKEAREMYWVPQRRLIAGREQWDIN